MAVTVVLVAVFGLFGTPVAPVTNIVPTVGGLANACAPVCLHEYFVMQQAWNEYAENGGYWAFMDFLRASSDYWICMSG